MLQRAQPLTSVAGDVIAQRCSRVPEAPAAGPALISLEMSLAISAMEATTESFQGLILRFRGRTALTQRQLAERSGASTRSVQAWEAGISYPGTDNLQALIACFLEGGGFAQGRQRAAAEPLWFSSLVTLPL